MKAGITISISLASCLILACLCCGCSQNRTMVGMWQGDRDWKKINADEAAARAGAAVDLDLKIGGDFLLKDGGQPFTGTWNHSGDKIDLRVETYMNRPIEHMDPTARKQLVFSARVDNGRLFFKNFVDEDEIELKKQAKP